MNKHILMLLENNTFRKDVRPLREASTLIQAGYRVSVICPRPKGARVWREVVDRVELHYFPNPPEHESTLGFIVEYGFAAVMMFSLTAWIGVRHGFDVLHAHNPPDIFFGLGILARLLGKKFVFDHHDLSPEMYDARSRGGSGIGDGGAGSKLVVGALVLCERLTCKAANIIIASNESYKQKEIERSKVRADAVHVVRNGPDLDTFRPTPPNLDYRGSASFVIGYVGILGPQDGGDYLLRSIANLVNTLNRRDVCCVIVGDGSAVPALKQLSMDLGISRHVRFTGRVPYDVVREVLSSVDLCVVPDPLNPYNNSSTVIKMMEYMAMSRPIVAFDLAENRFSAGDSALYATPNDEAHFAACIAELMDDPARRDEMGALGRKRVEDHLSWACQSKHLLAAYSSLFGV